MKKNTHKSFLVTLTYQVKVAFDTDEATSVDVRTLIDNGTLAPSIGGGGGVGYFGDKCLSYNWGSPINNKELSITEL